MSDSELTAKTALELALPGARMIFRTEQSHSECDFQLCYANGSTAEVEVTQALDQGWMQAVDRIYGKRPGSNILVATKCRNSWCVFVTRPPLMREIKAGIDDFLYQMENTGIEEFDWFRELPDWATVFCRTHNIVSCRRLGIVNEPEIRVSLSPEGGATGPTVLTEAAEREAEKADNRKKLGATNSKERHLVVHVSVSPRVHLGLLEFDPPRRSPRLPDEITDIWIIGQMADSQVAAWRANKSVPWHRVSIAP
jgi:hypothetical protein